MADLEKGSTASRNIKLSEATLSLCREAMDVVYSLELRQMAQFRVAFVSAREEAASALASQLLGSKSSGSEPDISAGSVAAVRINSVLLLEDVGALIAEIQARTKSEEVLSQVTALASWFALFRNQLMLLRTSELGEDSSRADSELICDQLGLIS